MTEDGWRPVTSENPIVFAPPTINTLIVRCCAQNATLRPSFATIVDELSGPCKIEIEADIYLRRDIRRKHRATACPTAENRGDDESANPGFNDSKILENVQSNASDAWSDTSPQGTASKSVTRRFSALFASVGSGLGDMVVSSVGSDGRNRAGSFDIPLDSTISDHRIDTDVVMSTNPMSAMNAVRQRSVTSPASKTADEEAPTWSDTGHSGVGVSSRQEVSTVSAASAVVHTRPRFVFEKAGGAAAASKSSSSSTMPNGDSLQLSRAATILNTGAPSSEHFPRSFEHAATMPKVRQQLHHICCSVISLRCNLAIETLLERAKKRGM
jgi:hypothetical protein